MLQTSTEVDSQWSESSKKEPVVLGGSEQAVLPSTEDRLFLSLISSLGEGWRLGREMWFRKEGWIYTEYWSRSREEPHQPCHIWIWLHQSLGGALLPIFTSLQEVGDAR